MPCVVTRIPSDQLQTRQAAKREIVQRVGQGFTASEARQCCPIPMHRTTVYRLLKRVEREGGQALMERRHGHLSILRGDVLTWVIEYCQSQAATASSELQRLVAERFRLSVSVSQLNRVRAAHGVQRVPPSARKKAENGDYDHLRIP